MYSLGNFNSVDIKVLEDSYKGIFPQLSRSDLLKRFMSEDREIISRFRSTATYYHRAFRGFDFTFNFTAGCFTLARMSILLSALIPCCRWHKRESESFWLEMAPNDRDEPQCFWRRIPLYAVVFAVASRDCSVSASAVELRTGWRCGDGQ